MSPLAIGSAQFGLSYGIANQTGQVPQREIKKMLQLGLASGIDTIDTAISYGDSEVFLGEIGTKGYKIVTKLPPIPDNCLDAESWVRSEVNLSLSRLGVIKIYGLLIHQSEELLGLHGKSLYNGLQFLKKTGQVQKVGVSIYSPNELDVLSPYFHFDLVQAPFNLIDRRIYNSGWLERLKDNGIEIHTRSVFLQGLLLLKRADIPRKFLRWDSLWNKWHQWLLSHNENALRACLSFPLSFPEIDRVVVGTDSIKQLSQVISTAKSRILTGLPKIQSKDENLLNPINWTSL